MKRLGFRTTQRFTGATACYTTFRPDFRSVDEDSLDAFGRQLRILKSCAIDDLVWIKYDEIRLVASTNQPPVMHLETASRK